MKLKSILTLGLLSLSSLAIAANNDIGVNFLSSPSAGTVCAGRQDIIVKIANYGDNIVTTFDVNWSIDGITQLPTAVATTLNSLNQPNSTYFLNLGHIDLPYNVPVDLKFWTSNPNATADPVKTNDTLTITLTASNPGIILTPISDTLICSNGSITFDAGYHLNTDYTWSNGTQAQQNTITLPGTYWLWAYNPMGCQAFDTFVVELLPNPSAANISVTEHGNRRFTFGLPNLANTDLVLWDLGDNTTQTGSGPITHTYSNDTVYQVKATLINECDSTIMDVLINADSRTSIKDIKALNKLIKLYPNPVINTLNINIENNDIKILQTRVINTLGQVVGQYEAGKNTIDLQHLPIGLYSVEIITNKGLSVQKIEKNN